MSMSRGDAEQIYDGLCAHYLAVPPKDRRNGFVEKIMNLDALACSAACETLIIRCMRFPSIAEITAATHDVAREIARSGPDQVSPRLIAIARWQTITNEPYDTRKPPPEIHQTALWELSALYPPVSLAEWRQARTWCEDGHRAWTERRAQEKRPTPPPPLDRLRYTEPPAACYPLPGPPPPGHPARYVSKAEGAQRLHAIIAKLTSASRDGKNPFLTDAEVAAIHTHWPAERRGLRGACACCATFRDERAAEKEWA